MKTRLNPFGLGNRSISALFSLGQTVRKSAMEKSLMELVHLRVSQLNNCAFCVDMHWKDARAAGESEQRLYMVSVWREAPFFSERERAAFAWAEALTILEKGTVDDEIFEQARKHFTDAELVDLTLAISTTGIYNRLNCAFGADVGSYKVGQFA
jgi:AhpD family alkylhydroperoxidase